MFQNKLIPAEIYNYVYVYVKITENISDQKKQKDLFL